MTDEEKDRLTNRLLDRTITEEERSALSDQVEQDDELAAKLRFHLALEEGQQRAYVAELEQTYQRQHSLPLPPPPARRRPLLLLSGLVLIIFAILLYLFFVRRPPFPFTPAEGRQLLEEAIAYEESVTQQIGVVAGSASWENLLLSERATADQYTEALSILEDRMREVGRCENARYAYFSGLLYLYAARNITEARRSFDCLIAGDDPRFREQLILHRILLLLADNEAEAATDLLTRSGMNPDRLPLRARERLTPVD